MNVRMSRAAPASRTSAKAISVTTRIEPALLWPTALPDRALFQSGAEIVARGRNSGQESKQNSDARGGQQCEDEHAPVQGDGGTLGADPRNVPRADS